MRNKERNITLYHADWCGHCKTFSKDWEQLADFVTHNNNKISKSTGITVNMKSFEEKNIDKSIKASLEGYPTIHIDGKVYEGERSQSELLKEIYGDKLDTVISLTTSKTQKGGKSQISGKELKSHFYMNKYLNYKLAGGGINYK